MSIGGSSRVVTITPIPDGVGTGCFALIPFFSCYFGTNCAQAFLLRQFGSCSPCFYRRVAACQSDLNADIHAEINNLRATRLKFRAVKFERECSVAILPIPTRLNFQMALIPGISSQGLQVHTWIGSLLWRYLRPGPDKLSPGQVVPGTIDGIDRG
jgi:hypothetical protein